MFFTSLSKKRMWGAPPINTSVTRWSFISQAEVKRMLGWVSHAHGVTCFSICADWVMTRTAAFNKMRTYNIFQPNSKNLFLKLSAGVVPSLLGSPELVAHVCVEEKQSHKLWHDLLLWCRDQPCSSGTPLCSPPITENCKCDMSYWQTYMTSYLDCFLMSAWVYKHFF